MAVVMWKCCKQDGQSRTIRQFQFTDWSDHGLPSSGETFIEFIGQVHKTKEQFGQDGPISVHCRWVARHYTRWRKTKRLTSLWVWRRPNISQSSVAKRLGTWLYLLSCLTVNGKVNVSFKPCLCLSDGLYIGAVSRRPLQTNWTQKCSTMSPGNLFNCVMSCVCVCVVLVLVRRACS